MYVSEWKRFTTFVQRSWYDKSRAAPSLDHIFLFRKLGKLPCSFRAILDVGFLLATILP
jgi:hypothetical protein